MAFTSLTSTTRPWRSGALASAAAAGGVAIAGVGLLLPGQPARAATGAAAGTLVNLTVDSAPALGITAFQGTYGAVGVPQNGGDAAADLSQDPDGVLKQLTVDDSAHAKTHADATKNWASSDLASAAGKSSGKAVRYLLHGKEIYSIGSLGTYAECTAVAAGSTAPVTVRTTAGSVTLLGTSVPEGKTTTVKVTGTQIGVSAVDHGELRMTYTTTATPSGSSASAASSAVAPDGSTTAHAHLDMSLAGTFYDSAGKQLFSGKLQQARFADVQATCEALKPTAPASSSTAPSAPASATSSATVPTNASTPPVGTSAKIEADEPAADPEIAEEHAATPGAKETAAHHTHHSARPHAAGSSGPNSPANGPMQLAGQPAAPAKSGSGSSWWWALLSAVGLGSGLLLVLATRRRGRHQ